MLSNFKDTEILLLLCCHAAANRYATWVGSASARATTGRNRWGRGSWWDRK